MPPILFTNINSLSLANCNGFGMIPPNDSHLGILGSAHGERAWVSDEGGIGIT